MTTADLHKILDDENRRLSLDELKQVIYELKQDCAQEENKLIDDYLNDTIKDDEYYHRNAGSYSGEQNAFQIALDLLEHLQDQEKVMNGICFDLGQLSYDLRPAQQGNEVNKVLQKYGYCFVIAHPCPNCGNEITIMKLGGTGAYLAYCYNCNCQVSIKGKNDAESVDEWNKYCEVKK